MGLRGGEAAGQVTCCSSEVMQFFCTKLEVAILCYLAATLGYAVSMVE